VSRAHASGFPARLKLVRERLGLGQEELAERLAVSQQTVSLWEKGQRKPGRGSWAVIEHRLGYTQDQMEHGHGFLPPEPRLADSRSGRAYPPIHLVPPRTGTDVMRLGASGLVAEALSLQEAQKLLREAVKAGRAVWMVVD
jgi:transcriptional regulator with XRE-family HTH domain